jgi:hypothetical protein
MAMRQFWRQALGAFGLTALLWISVISSVAVGGGGPARARKRGIDQHGGSDNAGSDHREAAERSRSAQHRRPI